MKEVFSLYLENTIKYGERSFQAIFRKHYRKQKATAINIVIEGADHTLYQLRRKAFGHC